MAWGPRNLEDLIELKSPWAHKPPGDRGIEILPPRRTLEGHDASTRLHKRSEFSKRRGEIGYRPSAKNVETCKSFSPGDQRFNAKGEDGEGADLQILRSCLQEDALFSGAIDERDVQTGIPDLENEARQTTT